MRETKKFEVYEELYKAEENIIVVHRRGVWCFQIMGNISRYDWDNCTRFDDCEEGLIKKTGGLKADVTKFIDLISTYKDNNWTLAYYKHLVAFKNPADRVIYIYNKKYFENRFNGSGDSSILSCKAIRYNATNGCME